MIVGQASDSRTPWWERDRPLHADAMREAVSARRAIPMTEASRPVAVEDESEPPTASKGSPAAGEALNEMLQLAVREQAAHVSEVEHKTRIRSIRREVLLIFTVVVMAVSCVAIATGGQLPLERHIDDLLDRVGLERPRSPEPPAPPESAGA
jgi:hypothetical protein